MPESVSEHRASGAGMPEDASIAGVPADYYRRIYDAEEAHWWHRGMRVISAALLADRLHRRGQAILDAGCGTGGFLRWIGGVATFERLCGVDISEEAITLARHRAPHAELGVAPLRELPFDDGSFDLVVVNDVLQHVAEPELDRSLDELRRVLRGNGTLFIRTNGGRRARRVRSDWRLYDRGVLTAALEQAGFRCERVTHANAVASLWAALRKGGPGAPTETAHGIPNPDGALGGALRLALLRAEAWYLARPRRTLPYGHTLFALAVRSETESGDANRKRES